MKEIIRTTITALIVMLTALIVILVVLVWITRPVAAQEKKPNIPGIWGDDIGLWNLSTYKKGMMGYRTPNIDRLAKIWAPHDLPDQDLRLEDIVTIFPKDAIPAILSPSLEEGSVVSWLKGKEAVIGIEINGDSRAYPVPILRRVEIINDRVGGIPIAVHW
jgi:hypothetical protein